VILLHYLSCNAANIQDTEPFKIHNLLGKMFFNDVSFGSSKMKV